MLFVVLLDQCLLITPNSPKCASAANESCRQRTIDSDRPLVTWQSVVVTSLTITTAVLVSLLNGNHSDNFTFFNIHQQCLITLLFRILIRLLLERPSVRSVRVPNSGKKHRKTKIGWSSNTTNYIK